MPKVKKPRRSTAAVAKALEENRGNVAAAARSLGYHRLYLTRRINADPYLTEVRGKLIAEHGRADMRRKPRSDQKASTDDIEFALRSASGSIYHAARECGIGYNTLKERLEREPHLQAITESVRAEQFGEALIALRTHVRHKKSSGAEAVGSLPAVFKAIDLFAPRDFHKPSGLELTGPGGTPLFLKEDPRAAALAAAKLLESVEKWEAEQKVKVSVQPLPPDESWSDDAEDEEA